MQPTATPLIQLQRSGKPGRSLGSDHAAGKIRQESRSANPILDPLFLFDSALRSNNRKSIWLTRGAPFEFLLCCTLWSASVNVGQGREPGSDSQRKRESLRYCACSHRAGDRAVVLFWRAAAKPLGVSLALSLSLVPRWLDCDRRRVESRAALAPLSVPLVCRLKSIMSVWPPCAHLLLPASVSFSCPPFSSPLSPRVYIPPFTSPSIR